MQDIFVTKIHIEKVRHLKNLDIELSDTERKHLILAGKNGSGKTSLLEAMRDEVEFYQDIVAPYKAASEYRAQKELANVSTFFSKHIDKLSDIMFIYVPARRSAFSIPKAIEEMQVTEKTSIKQSVSKEFLNYILSLDYQLYGAKADNDRELEKSLTKWFDNFLNALRNIYDCMELKLQRDAKKLSFTIKMPGREPFALNEMSDGYTAFLNIVMELLMRFEIAGAAVDYEKSAIAMIDEIEAHLHVELQKRVLPFLTQMFPNVQFIVATHSPFVMTSLENAIVYDLEKRERLEKPSFYSYDAVVESFLDTGMYSDEIKKHFSRYKELCLKERTPEENNEFLITKAELEIRALPSTELYIAFQELEKTRKAAKK